MFTSHSARVGPGACWASPGDLSSLLGVADCVGASRAACRVRARSVRLPASARMKCIESSMSGRCAKPGDLRQRKGATMSCTHLEGTLIQSTRTRGATRDCSACCDRRAQGWESPRSRAWGWPASSSSSRRTCAVRARSGPRPTPSHPVRTWRLHVLFCFFNK